jgi:hypothetical protein
VHQVTRAKPLRDLLPQILPVLVGSALALALARIVATLGFHVSQDPNEGWNAYQALQFMSNGTLYPPPDSLWFNNYPPLSFLVVGAIGKTLGDYIVAGRIVSLVSALSIAAAVIVVSRIMKADRWSSVFASLLLLAGLVMYSDYVGMDDPQLLGHAIAIFGLIPILRRTADLPAIIFAALLLTVSVFIKHNLIALPAALLIWLAIEAPRSAVVFAVAGAGLTLLGLVAFRLTFGVGLLTELNSPRLYALANLIHSVSAWLVWSEVMLCGFLLVSVLRRQDKYVLFCSLYALISIGLGTILSGGTGVDMNIWFDAAIALSFGASLLFTELGSHPISRYLAAGVYAMPLLVGIAMQYNGDWLDRSFWLEPRQSEVSIANAEIAFLNSHRGPALCENLALCYWAGKKRQVDVFNLGQAYATKERDARALQAMLARHGFGVLQFDSLEKFPLGPNVRKAVLKYYRVDHQDDDGVFLLSR